MLPATLPEQRTDLTLVAEPFNLEAERAQFVADRDVMRLAAAVYDPAITHVGKWHRLTNSDLTALGINPELDSDHQAPSTDLAPITRYADYIETQYQKAQETFWSAGPDLLALREEVVARGRAGGRPPNLQEAIAASPGADTKYGKLFRARRRFEEHTLATSEHHGVETLSLS